MSFMFQSVIFQYEFIRMDGGSQSQSKSLIMSKFDATTLSYEIIIS